MVRAIASPAQNPQQRLSVVEINALKFRMVADRLIILLSSGVSSAELFKLCLCLARLFPVERKHSSTDYLFLAGAT
ncbi:uncharacterized protein A4U43_C08F12330 [Asparagus officinalis]|nr:uncharacterized protein A4U43_C08F12330 [Asparagus officinalis]